MGSGKVLMRDGGLCPHYFSSCLGVHGHSTLELQGNLELVPRFADEDPATSDFCLWPSALSKKSQAGETFHNRWAGPGRAGLGSGWYGLICEKKLLTIYCF